MGDEHWQFPLDPRQHYLSFGVNLELLQVTCLGNSDGKQRLAIFARLPAAQSGSHATRRETREHSDGRQELAISQDPRHHHPVPKQQKGRQEEIYAGSARREKEARGCYDWKQGLTISRDPRHHYPVRELQEGRQADIMMGHKDFPAPPAPRSISQAARREQKGRQHVF